MTRKIMTMLSLLVVFALILGACGRGGNETPTAVPAAPAAAATEAPAAATEAPAASTEVTTTEAMTPTEAVTATEAMTATEAVTPTESMTATEATTATESMTATEATTATSVSTATTPMIAGGYLEQAMAGKFKGTTIKFDGPFADADARKFQDSVKPFEDATGITVEYIGGKGFEASINTRVDAGDAPDIADFPQPGLLANLVKAGKVVDVNSFLPMEYLQQQYLQSWIDMSQMEAPTGTITAGVWTRFNGKSIVWYPKKAWDEAGYTIPTTWDELKTLQDTIVADGDTPWCIGIESGAATGWPATDWMEDIMLRTTSLENYDKWVKGELPFSSPEVMNAAQTMSDIWLNKDMVYGGKDAIISTNFGNAPAPMFEDPPKCWMHRQGNFITSFFPAGLKAGVDYDFFYFPPIDEQYGKPFLVAGDIYAMFNDRPEVRAAMEFFSRGESLKPWLQQGGTLATQKDVNLDWYGDPVERGLAKLASEATSVRFDASDMMPGEVGAGTFWTGMTSYIAGTVDLETAMKEIDASWPKAK